MGTIKARAETASTTLESEFSPLDQIRQIEAEITRRVAAAHQAADRNLAEARQEAAQIKRQAQENGRREGLARYQEIVSKVEVEAQALVAQAQDRAEELSRRGEQYMDRAVQEAVEIILGLETDRRAR